MNIVRQINWIPVKPMKIDSHVLLLKKKGFEYYREALLHDC